MTALLARIKRLTRGSQTRGPAASLRRVAADPRRRAQARRLLGKLRHR
ncbi:hypothetical protein ABZ615_11785 [Streptomyces sp. NPDC007325]